MIINNQNLPYNLRISQNEPIVEIKETGETVNLLRLTTDGARLLAGCLYNWAVPVGSAAPTAPPTSSQPEPNPEEISSSPAKDEELI